MFRRLISVAGTTALVFGVFAGNVRAFAPQGASVVPEIPLPGSNRAVQVDVTTTADSRITDFANQFGGRWSVSWNALTGTPHLVIGSGTDYAAAGIHSEAAARAAAKDVVASSPALFGASASDLEIVSVEHGLGKWAVHFQQQHAGIPVQGGLVRVAFTDEGRLILLGSDAYAVHGVSTTPSISRDRAMSLAATPVGYDGSDDEVSGADLVILPLDLATGLEYRLAWRVGVRVDAPIGNWRIFVDARTGDVLGRENLVRTATVGGSVKADVQFFGYCDGTTPNLPLAGNRVNVVGQGTAVTDAAGNWSLTTTGSGPYTVRDSLKGSFSKVTVYGAPPDAATSGTVSEGSPLATLWNAGNARKDERDCFYNVNYVHDKMKSIDPTFTGLDYSMTTTVGRTDGYCPGNAWWDGSGINLCDPSATYANTGEIGNVVYHEYGHGITAKVYASVGEPGGDLHEGNSDVIACYLQDVPIVGIGFYVGNCTGGIRNLSNSLRYPQDTTGEGHHDGQIIGGFHWDAREYLKAAVGQPAADSIAYGTWHFARKLGHPYTQPDQVYWTFLMDDDDGNLDNGTPHHAQFCQAATNHNFACPEILTGVQIAHIPLTTTTDPFRVNAVTATIVSTEAAINPAASYVSYRVNGGAYSNLPLIYDSGSGTYSATIPFQPQTAQVDYYIYAEDVLGNFRTSPSAAPATLYSFDVAYLYDTLEIASGWTVGALGDAATTGVWERADPQGTAAQPEDDHTPAPGTQCFVTQAAAGGSLGDFDVDGGATTLLSPVFNLSGGSDITIKYFRWYTNDTGADPNNDYWKVDISNDGGGLWTSVENTLVSDHFWKPISRPLTDFFPTPGSVKLRFIASDLASGSLVEAGVDDFEVLADFGVGTAVEVSGREGGMPDRYALGAANPNPFNPKTVINYDLPRQSRVSLKIFDVEGREVRSLVATTQAAGRYGVTWDGRDNRGVSASSGVYFYRLDANDFTATAKMVLGK